MTDATTASWALDALLVVGLALYAGVGYTRGLLHVVGSVIGFAGGGALGLRFAPGLVEPWSEQLPGTALTVILLTLVLVCALIGQALCGAVTRLFVRGRPVLGPIDRVGGAIATAVIAAATLWLGAGLMRVAFPGDVARVLDSSRVLRAVDDLSPVPRERALDEVTALLVRYEFPRVFEGAAPTLPEGDGDPSIANDPDVQWAGLSVVRIDASAPQCGGVQEGSGFVVAPGLVVTNAHVVTGSDHVTVTRDFLSSTARVVAFDPGRDVAVLAADTAALSPLPITPNAVPVGTNGAIVGFPLGGPFRLDAARVGAHITARGRDIYGEDTVVRHIYGVRARIHPGNSGGPLLTTDGKVAGLVFARAEDSPDTAYVLRPDEITPVIESAAAGTEVPVGGCAAGR